MVCIPTDCTCTCQWPQVLASNSSCPPSVSQNACTGCPASANEGDATGSPDAFTTWTTSGPTPLEHPSPAHGFGLPASPPDDEPPPVPQASTAVTKPSGKAADVRSSMKPPQVLACVR